MLEWLLGYKESVRGELRRQPRRLKRGAEDGSDTALTSTVKAA